MRDLQSKPSKARSSTLFPVRVDQKLLEAISIEAAKAGTTQSHAVRQILAEWLRLRGHNVGA
jgi:predicted HicB family RNase H-like nuclease